MKEPLRRLTNERLPMKMTFRLSKMIKQMDAELETLEDARISLIKELGTEDEQGGVSVKPENVETFQKEYMELVNEDIEIDSDPLDIDDFPDVKITTQDMMLLTPIFEE
jgi:hypothetical protein